jgi:hypothetical protein
MGENDHMSSASFKLHPIFIMTVLVLTFVSLSALSEEQQEYVPPDDVADTEKRVYEKRIRALNDRYEGFFELQNKRKMQDQKRREGAIAHKGYRKAKTREYNAARKAYIRERRPRGSSVKAKRQHDRLMKNRQRRREKAREYFIRNRKAIKRHSETAKRIPPALDVGLEP